MLLQMFNRFILLLLLAHCLFVAHWCRLGNVVADASIVVVATNVTYLDRIAAFGPRLPDDGLEGFLVLIETIDPDNKDACRELKTPLEDKDLIVLVDRGSCTFIDKVRNMQASGAMAVVVGDPERNGLITMYATGDVSDVRISSVFVGRRDYHNLRLLKDHSLIRLVKDDLLQPLLDVIIVVILSPTVVMIFIYVLWRIRQRQLNKQDIAPQQVVYNLPTKIFYDSKRQNNEPQECAICLEDYVDEDELRIMPCKHEFHVACIDSWLTTRKKFCPICKRDICLPTEDTPLLSNREPTP